MPCPKASSNTTIFQDLALPFPLPASSTGLADTSVAVDCRGKLPNQGRVWVWV